MRKIRIALPVSTFDNLHRRPTFLKCSSLIPDLDQIVAQLLDCIRRRSGLDSLGVMRNENRLRRLNNHHALTTLHRKSQPS